MSPRRLAPLAIAAALALWPFIGGVPAAIVNDATRAEIYALVATSLVVLTGWVGQISLAQGTFVGIGAIATALLFRHLGVPFPLSLPLAVAAGAAAAILLGLVALRVRGLYLAVATLIFAWMADAWLFPAPWFIGSDGSASLLLEPIGRPGAIPSFDLYDPRIMHLIVLAGLALGIYTAANLRESKTGRAFFAVRGSEMAAASLGIDVTRYKLLAFGISGGMAGLGGHLQMVWQGSVVPTEFSFLTSLFYLSIAVVGGTASLAGAVAAGALFSALNEVFFRIPALNGYIDLVSALLLLGVLLAYPGGLAAAGRSLTRRFRIPLSGLLARPSTPATSPQPDPEPEAGPAQPSLFEAAPRAAGVEPTPADRSELAPVLEAEGVTVRFGGLVAVDRASLEVRRGEIVGLIGPNGAGKTTLFNAVAGFVTPADGAIRMFGREVTDLPVHERAALGVGRTFQLIQLFRDLDVFDNVLVGTHVLDPTGFVQHVAVTERALAADRAARERAREVIHMLDLSDVAHRRTAELPFGTLRIVELARALATGSPFVMLDEPASGLDNAETDRLMELLFWVRSNLGVSLLLIEHDVRMVTGVSDHMYVLDRGRIIAQGAPATVQRDPAVIAAYLGDAPGSEPAAQALSDAGVGR